MSPLSGGAGDMFLLVKGAKHGLIKGESLDSTHKGEIEVLSWSWGMQARPSLGGGGASGKATINDLRIVIPRDTSQRIPHQLLAVIAVDPSFVAEEEIELDHDRVRVHGELLSV